MKSVQGSAGPIRQKNIGWSLSQTLSVAACALLLTAAGPAPAQTDETPPPLVGRVASVNGTVSFHTGDQQDWSQAGVNEPLSVGDAIYAGPDGSARLELGATDFLLRGDSEVDIAALDDRTGQIRLDSGTVDIRMLASPTDEGLVIATPRGSVRLTERGLFRIEAGTESDPTRVTVWEGSATFGDNGPSTPLRRGQTLVVSGSPDDPQFDYEQAPGDIPEQWRERPRITATSRYVPPDVTGAADLDDYGSWQQAPDYGAVWYPSSVPEDWAPYHDGHWAFVPPWGWTWVDDEPWGFAPFHYGRWANIDGRWGWCPGRYERHEVYAPALVAFVGGAGIGVGLSLAFGGGDEGGPVGWVPLAPGEYYRPPYDVNRTYIQNINKTVIVNRVSNVTNVYNKTVINNVSNTSVTAASLANNRFATVVPANAMRNASPVARAALSVPPANLAKAAVAPRTVAAITPAVQRPAGRPGPVTPPPPQAATQHAALSRPALLPGRPGGTPAAVRPPQAPQGQVQQPGQPPRPGAPAAGPEGMHPAGIPAPRPPQAPEAGHPAGIPAPRPPQAPEIAHPAGGIPAPHPPQAPEAGHPVGAPAPHPLAGPSGHALPPPPAPPRPASAVPGLGEHPAARAPAPFTPHPAAEPARPPMNRPEQPPAAAPHAAEHAAPPPPMERAAPAPHPAPAARPEPAPYHPPAPAPAYHPPAPAPHPAPAPAYHPPAPAYHPPAPAPRPAPAPAYHPPAPAPQFHAAPPPQAHPAPPPQAHQAPAQGRRPEDEKK